jgi:hypothetical protein
LQNDRHFGGWKLVLDIASVPKEGDHVGNLTLAGVERDEDEV